MTVAPVTDSITSVLRKGFVRDSDFCTLGRIAGDVRRPSKPAMARQGGSPANAFVGGAVCGITPIKDHDDENDNPTTDRSLRMEGP